MKMELTLFGSRVTEDEAGFICLNDLWRAAGSHHTLRPGIWKSSKRTSALAQALEQEIIRNPDNLEVPNNKSVIYSTGRGRGAKTFAHPILALDYTEWLSPELGVEMRRVFLRYRANDMTLAKEMMERLKAQFAEDRSRVDIREEFTDRYREFRARAHRAGCRSPSDYTFVNSGGYEGFYGGKSLSQVKEMKALPADAPLPDYMGSEEANANTFRVKLTSRYMDSRPPHDVPSAFDAAHYVGGEVRDFMMRLGAPAPETLPASDHINEARKRIRRVTPLLEDDPDADIDPPDPKHDPG